MIATETVFAPVPQALAPHEQRRERALLDLLKASTIAHAETADGYLLRIAGGAPTLAQLGDLIALARRRCPFLGFDLRCPPEDGEVALRIWGPHEAKASIRGMFVEQS
jgi:hypothetical protein